MFGNPETVLLVNGEDKSNGGASAPPPTDMDGLLLLNVYDGIVDQMFAQEPNLHFVGPHDIAD